MKILHAIAGIDPSFGGTSTAVVGLALAQAKAGMDVRVISTTVAGADGGSNKTALEAAGVRLTQIGPTKGRMQKHPKLKAAAIEAVQDADVLHVHGLWEHLQHYATREAAKLGVPYVWTPHGMLDPWSLSQRAWFKKLLLMLRTRRDLNGAAAMHFTTVAEREAVKGLNLLPPSIVEPIGMDLAEVDPRPPSGLLREKFPAIASRRVTLFLSRLHPKKGLDLLLPAFAKVAGKDDVLVLAGPAEAEYEKQLRDEAAKLNLGDRVVFTGMLRGRDRFAAMADASLFVLPSYQENFGIVVAEAMAMECPVLISDAVNLAPELSRAGTVEVVPTKIEPLAEAMRRIWDDPDSARSRATRGRAYVEQWFDWSNIATRWAGHYGRIAAGRREVSRDQ